MNVHEFQPVIIKTELEEEKAQEEKTQEEKAQEECDEDQCSEKSTERAFKMNHYCKKTALSYFKNNRTNLKKLFKNFKCPSEEIENYVNEKASVTQENVHYECGSPTFQAINIWLEKFKERKFNLSQNELGLIVRLIAATEEHPDPELCEGINFRDLYNFLGTVMNGEPTVELNQPTKQFLWECFQEIADDVNDQNGDRQLSEFQQKLKSNQAGATDANRLDPLNINIQ